MTQTRVLQMVVCGARPASEIARLVELAKADRWDVHLIATPAGRDFLELPILEALTGHPVRPHTVTRASHETEPHRLATS